MEKSSRTTLHYAIQNDGARDLVLPPLGPIATIVTHSSNVHAVIALIVGDAFGPHLLDGSSAFFNG